MISKSDCILLLSDLQKDGIPVSEQLNKLIRSNEVPLEIIDFINSHRQLDLRAFYEKIRKSYNNKKSKLYLNIVKYDSKPQEAITTLASLSLQILLFSKNLQNVQMFLKHSRFDEIIKCLYNYSQSYDITESLKLLALIKCDLKCLEQISNKKENT